MAAPTVPTTAITYTAGAGMRKEQMRLRVGIERGRNAGVYR